MKTHQWLKTMYRRGAILSLWVLAVCISLGLCFGTSAFAQNDNDERPKSGVRRSKSRRAKKVRNTRKRRRLSPRRRRAKRAKRRFRNGQRRERRAQGVRSSGARPGGVKVVPAGTPAAIKASPTMSIFRRKNTPKDGIKPLLETVPEVSPLRASSLFSAAPSLPKPVVLEGAKPPRPVGVRQESEVTPGASSRWSNLGAIEPVESEVPLQAPLPVRNLPRPVGVTTAGQRLRGDEQNLFSGRVSLSGIVLSVLTQPDDTGSATSIIDSNNIRPPLDSLDVQFVRARVSGLYERIGGSQFFVNVDAELRPQFSSGDQYDNQRFDDQRLNAAYIGWGIGDLRPKRKGDPSVGFAVGRLAVREAGFAQADGALFRVRPTKGFDIGAFGGFTANPYGYRLNGQNQRIADTFSTDWATGGGFLSFRRRSFQLSAAGVATLTLLDLEPEQDSLERVYLFADASWQPARDVSIFASGYFDLLPSGQSIQNADLALAWTPNRFNLRASVGRFSTIIYEDAIQSVAIIDGLGNRFSPDDARPIASPSNLGQQLTPFNAATQVAAYYNGQLSAGYRLLPPLETYVRVRALIRDTADAEAAVAPTLVDGIPSDNAATPSSLRLVPSIGVRFQNPKIVNANGEVIIISDDESQTDTILRAGIGRGFGGFNTRVDGRLFFGEIGGYDGGVSLSYALPRDLNIGFLQFLISLRYYRENSLNQLNVVDGTVVGGDDFLFNQETLLGFAGIEWRL